MVLKLSYFNIRGLGEVPRLIMTDAGVQFEDHRIGWDEWSKYKPTMTFGQVPCLFDGDEQIVQSGTIVRRLARKLNYDGTTEAEKTFIDMFYEGVRDLHAKYTRLIYNEYDSGKAAYIKDYLPVQFAAMEKLFKTHSKGEKYVAGEKVSYADLALFEELDIHLILAPGCLDKFPALKAFHQRFVIRPSLQAHLAKRAAAKYKINGNDNQ